MAMPDRSMETLAQQFSRAFDVHRITLAVCERYAATFEEEKHPRDDSGEFMSGGSVSAPKGKRKLPRKLTQEDLDRARARTAELKKQLEEALSSLVNTKEMQAETIRKQAEQHAAEISDLKSKIDTSKTKLTEITKSRKALDRVTDRADDAGGNDRELEAKRNAALRLLSQAVSERFSKAFEEGKHHRDEDGKFSGSASSHPYLQRLANPRRTKEDEIAGFESEGHRHYLNERLNSLADRPESREAIRILHEHAPDPNHFQERAFAEYLATGDRSGLHPDQFNGLSDHAFQISYPSEDDRISGGIPKQAKQQDAIVARHITPLGDGKMTHEQLGAMVRDIEELVRTDAQQVLQRYPEAKDRIESEKQRVLSRMQQIAGRAVEKTPKGRMHPYHAILVMQSLLSAANRGQWSDITQKARDSQWGSIYNTLPKWKGSMAERFAAAFSEGDHPRKENGKFSSSREGQPEKKTSPSAGFKQSPREPLDQGYHAVVSPKDPYVREMIEAAKDEGWDWEKLNQLAGNGDDPNGFQHTDLVSNADRLHAMSVRWHERNDPAGQDLPLGPIPEGADLWEDHAATHFANVWANRDRVLREFAQLAGIKAPNPLSEKFAKAFDESQHPRGTSENSGQFTKQTASDHASENPPESGSPGSSEEPDLPGTHPDISSLLKAITSEKKKPGDRPRWKAYRTVAHEEAEKIRTATHGQLNVEGAWHVIDEDGILHILGEHGPDSKLRKPNEPPVTMQDIAMVPWIIRHPDSVELSNVLTLGHQLPAIVYRKRINGHVVCVEEVRKGGKKLTLHSMYKNPARKGEGGTTIP